MVLDKAAKRLRRYWRSYNLRLVNVYRSLREMGLPPGQALPLAKIISPVKAPSDKVLEMLGVSRKRKKDLAKKRQGFIPNPSPNQQKHGPKTEPQTSHRKRNMWFRGANRRHPQ